MITTIIQWSWAKISLFPCVQSMAISAQQFNIIHICSPVLKPPSPVITAVLWPYFVLWIYMVNIKRPIVIKPAFNTLTSERCDKFKFSFPVPAFLVGHVTIFIPIRFLAIWIAKPCFAFFSAIKAESVLFPSIREIARLTAINTIVFFYAIALSIKFITTAFAMSVFSCFWSTWRSCFSFIPNNFFSSNIGAWSRTKSPAISVGIKSDAAHFASFFHACIIMNLVQKNNILRYCLQAD